MRARVGNVQFFAKFGSFLCITVTLAWSISNVILMALLSLFGPMGSVVEKGGEKKIKLSGSLFYHGGMRTYVRPLPAAMGRGGRSPATSAVFPA